MARTAEDQALIDSLAQRAERAEAQVDALEQAASRLRHDVRGILSPALLLADRLTGSDDPIARRTAESVIRTIERVEEALSRDV